MRNNTQWFQSPRPNSFNFAQAHQHSEQFPELPQIHPNNLTPTSIVHHPHSPFIPLPVHQRPEGGTGQEEKEEGRRGISQLVVFSEEEGEEVTPYGQPKAKHNQEILTTGRKSSVQRPHGPKKTRPKDKGLRGLSLKALHTVIAMGSGTYKEVATRLLLTLEEQGQGHKSANEQTNIKRRVYDALNVLISLGLLRKEGRLIVGDASALNNTQQDQKECNRLRNKVAIKELDLYEKREKLRETEEKCKGIQGLFRRNQLTHNAVQQAGTYIPFPFIGVLASEGQWNMMGQREEEVELRFKERVHPFGDIDSLRQLQKHFK